MKKPNASKVILFIVLLVIFVWCVSPSLLFFLDDAGEAQLASSIRQHFSAAEDERFGITLPRFITIVAAVAITWAAYLLVHFLLAAIPWKTRRQATVASLLTSVCRYAAVLIGIFWSLSVLGVDTTAMFASVGIVALIVGFGAQSLIEDIITGIFIIFEGQYNVGDIIILDDFRGSVVNIGVRTTVIQDAGGNLKIVNNSDIRNLQNRSASPSVALCDVSIGYGENLEAVEELLKKSFPAMREAHPDIFRSDPEYLGVQSLADSAVVLRIMAEVDESNVFAGQRMLNREVKLLFDKNGVSIPFPQLTVHGAEK